MAKRIAFAWVTFQYDFDSYEEAMEYIRENRTGKGWMVDEEPYKQSRENVWTVEVRKPYSKKYFPGW